MCWTVSTRRSEGKTEYDRANGVTGQSMAKKFDLFDAIAKHLAEEGADFVFVEGESDAKLLGAAPKGKIGRRQGASDRCHGEVAHTRNEASRRREGVSPHLRTH